MGIPILVRGYAAIETVPRLLASPGHQQPFIGIDCKISLSFVHRPIRFIDHICGGLIRFIFTWADENFTHNFINSPCRSITIFSKYSLLMHGIEIGNPAKFFFFTNKTHLCVGHFTCAFLHSAVFGVRYLGLAGGNITRKLLSLSLDLFFKIFLFQVAFLITPCWPLRDLSKILGK